MAGEGQGARFPVDSIRRDSISSLITRVEVVPRGISLNHVCVRLIMAADGKTSRRCAGCTDWTYRAAVVYHISSDTELAVRAHREYCHRSAVIVGYEDVLARRMDAEVGRARSFGTDGI